jgi:hypothetical protein
MNPLKIQPIRLHRATSNQPAHTTVSETNGTVKRVGAYLMEMLKIQYEHKDQPIMGLSAKEAVEQLNRQIRSYAQGLYPFDQPIGDNEEPEDWWRSLLPSPHANVLAVCLSVEFCIYFD